MKTVFPALCILFLLVRPSGGRCQDYPAQLEKPVDEAISIRQKTQKASDRWEAERLELEAVYDRLAAEQRQLTAHVERLGRKADTLQAANDSLESRLTRIERITAGLAPFLEEAFERLDAFVKADAPFLAEERGQRLLRLWQTLDDPLVTVGEKLRKTLEALFVEAEYGNTVEIYRDKVDLEGRKILADIFRLGRVSLFFSTLDGKTAGRWDPAENAWQPLSETFNRAVHEAMEMAAKRRSVEVVSLPLGRIAAP